MFLLYIVRIVFSICIVKKYCLGSERGHEVFFRNAEEIFSKYPSELPKFLLMFFGSRLIHESLNNLQVSTVLTTVTVMMGIIYVV